MSASEVIEETPLLGGDINPTQGEDDVYTRFSFFEKQRILSIVCFSGLLTFFASGVFVPTIAVIAKDLSVRQEDINLTVAIYILVTGFGGLIWGRYSGYYGRRPVYLLALPTYILGSLGVSLSQTIWHLAFTRAIQGFGTSCFLSTGIATVSDIFKLEERGRAMGVYASVVLIGPSVAPFIGGLVSRYLSWRWMQLILAIGAVLAYGLIIKWLPETIHPGVSGYEKALSEEFANDPPAIGDESEFALNGTSKARKRIFVFLNPLASLDLLRSPVLLLSTTAGAISLITDYFFLVPISYVFHEYFHIDNELVVGAIFLPSGLGNIFGALLAGYLSDHYIISGERSRPSGSWLPEDRLRAAVASMGLIMPISVLGYGFTTQFVGGTKGIVLSCFWLFVNGIGVDSVLGPCNTYAVDIFITRNAEVSAVASALRQLFNSATSGAALPLIKSIGMANAGIVLAISCWIGYLMLLVNIRYGQQLRDWKDMGYTLRSR